MQATVEIKISKSRMELEQHKPGFIKVIFKNHACMKFYNEKEPLYFEIDALGVGLVAGLLHVRNETHFPQDKAPEKISLHPIAFVSKGLSSAEVRYSNSKEALRILHGLQKFHHYCLTCVVSVIRDHKPLVAIFKKML